MEKTYTESCDFKIIIEGHYICGNLFEEELCQINTDNIWDYVASNITDFYRGANIKIFNERTEEE